MSTPARRPAIWLLIPLFVAATGGGEAWHLVPGNGHWLELPGGYLPCGFSVGATTGLVDSAPAVARQVEWPASLEAVDGCRICQVTGQAKSLSPAAIRVPVLPAQHGPPRRAVEVLRLSGVRSFDVRGPPSV